MSSFFRPMLAAAVDTLAAVPPGQYLVSAKYDGVRATIIDGAAQSRSGKLIPNVKLQLEIAKRPWMNGMDGEFIFGSATASDVYRSTTSAVMTADGSAEGIVFYAFDWYLPGVEYSLRYVALANALREQDDSFARLVEHELVSAEQLCGAEEQALLAGYEGLMLRGPNGHYKHGRSTLRERGLLKLKRFTDFEATIIGAEELMINSNAPGVDELGYAKRSTSKSGLLPGGTLGALHCATPDGVSFRCGSGLSAQDRAELWAMHARCELVGRTAKIKSFPVGVKDAPRFPIFLGLRSEVDL